MLSRSSIYLPGPHELFGPVHVLGCPRRQVCIEPGMPRRRDSVSLQSASRSSPYWRIVSNKRKRLPRSLSSATTSERDTNAVTKSMTSSRSTGSPLQISSTASSALAPGKTAIRASRRCSARSSAARMTSRSPRVMSRAAQQRRAVPGKDLESAVETTRELGGTRSDHACSGQLDGQGHSIKALAHLRHGTGVAVGQREVGFNKSCPLDEQPDGICGCGDAPWRQPECRFPVGATQ